MEHLARGTWIYGYSAGQAGQITMSNPINGEYRIKWEDQPRELVYPSIELHRMIRRGFVRLAKWERVRKGTGIQYQQACGRVEVKRVSWIRPGFRRVKDGHMATGWAIVVNGEQYGAAHRTATAARETAELPGVWRDISSRLG